MFINKENKIKGIKSKRIKERKRFKSVSKIITYKALSLMQIAHLQSISFARIYKLNKTTFTYYTINILYFNYILYYIF